MKKLVTIKYYHKHDANAIFLIISRKQMSINCIPLVNRTDFVLIHRTSLVWLNTSSEVKKASVVFDGNRFRVNNFLFLHYV